MNISGIKKSTGEFIKGNAAGVQQATKAVLIERPCHYLKTRAQVLFTREEDKRSYLNYADNFISVGVAHRIEKAYKNGGAPKSGEFWTQSVGNAAKKLVNFITFKK